MFFLNLSPVEFLMLLGAVSGVAVALYLLDRSRRKQVVPTLRFWNLAEQPVSMKHRRRIQQPWSLILQLLGMALLLLALAQLRLGSPEGTAPEHVVLLDTSSWMAAQSRTLGRNQSLMDEGRRLARRFVEALPASHRVMLVRVDGLATPATRMESDRTVLRDAIARSTAGVTALNLGQAVEFALQFQRLHSKRPGEIVFIGAGRIADDATTGGLPAIPSLRVIPVSATVENVGLRRIGLRRSADEPGLWNVFVSIRNYGVAAHDVPLMVKFAGSPVGSRRITVAPGADQEISFSFRSQVAGWVEARLLVQDDLAEDNRAVLEIPRQRTLKVTVYSTEPDLLRPLFSSNPRVVSEFRSPSAYAANSGADVVVLDRFRPPQLPTVDTIWIDPPREGSPFPVRASREKVPLTSWRTDHPLGAGLRARDIQLEAVTVYEPAPNDIPIAEVDSGPVILARPGKPRQVAMGFHPTRSALRYELVTPLLFANLLRWMEPDVFSSQELNAAGVGAVNVDLDRGIAPDTVQVTSEKGALLPFSVRDRTLHFFSGDPGIVRVTAGTREIVYSLTLPEIAEASWKPPATALQGIPPRSFGGALSRDLWPWLAALGALLLAAEWMLFGRGRLRFMPRAAVTRMSPLRRIWKASTLARVTRSGRRAS